MKSYINGNLYGTLPVPEKLSKVDKRIRTKFTDFQKRIMECVFNETRYIKNEKVKTLASKLQLSDKNIRYWFQNKRTRGKKENSRSAVQANLDFNPGYIQDDQHQFLNRPSHIKPVLYIFYPPKPEEYQFERYRHASLYNNCYSDS